MTRWRIKPQDNHKRKKWREGTEVYRHSKGYFIVLELQGRGGTYREAFRPDELVPA